MEGRKSSINVLADSQHKKAKQSLLVGGKISSKKKVGKLQEDQETSWIFLFSLVCTSILRCTRYTSTSTRI